MLCIVDSSKSVGYKQSYNLLSLVSWRFGYHTFPCVQWTMPGGVVDFRFSLSQTSFVMTQTDGTGFGGASLLLLDAKVFDKHVTWLSSS